MINDGLLTPDAGLQLTEGVRKAVQRLKEIVNTMFDVSQIDTETLVLELFPTSVALTVNEAVDPWATALKERKQTLTVEGLADLPTILADRKRLEQAFSHLIQNAMKFTPDGGQIRITGRLLGEKMPPRIAPDDLEHIFEKFYRVGNVMLHSTGKTKFKGAGPGLGLTIARGIVGAHGGRIWAESPGCDEETCPGSEFHVVLPVQPRHLEAAGSEAFIAAVRAATDQVSRTI
jgi:signal transduction histidine kinase